MTSKPPAPTIIRKGCVAQVPGNQHATDFEVKALSFLDLRFSDGHVERWLGPGSTVPFATAADFLATVEELGADVNDTQGECLLEELEMSFSDVPRELNVPSETVVEWNAELNLPPDWPPFGDDVVTTIE
jgi:hypothetical protein